MCIAKRKFIFQGGGDIGITYRQLCRPETGSSHVDKLFSVTGVKILCHIIFLYLAIPLLFASGKDGKMKKLIDFEYDLWTTEDGKCMVRVRPTGEECEVDRETFRLLRAEEKRLRRERTPERISEGQVSLLGQTSQPLSLQTICSGENEDGEFWLEDSTKFEENIILSLALKEFWDRLTATQQEVYRLVIVNGFSYKHCADICGVTYQAVQKSIQQMRKKAKSFFG